MRYLIGIISFLLSYIIPKKKDLYIFGSINGKTFSGNSKTMFLYFLNVLKYKNIFYFTRNKNLFKLDIQNLININSLKGYFLFLRAEYIFVDCDLYDINLGLSYQPGKFNVINLWHGDPIKSIGYLSKANYSKHKNGIFKKVFKNYFNNVVKLGTTSSLFFQNILNKGHLTNKYKITGLARNEIFFNNKLDFFNVKEKFKLSNYKKIILYVPTWRQDKNKISPFSNTFLKKLNFFCENNNFLFLIKAHQNSEKVIIGKHTNIKDISNEIFDIQELMKYTDIMITDYSSIFIDFMLLDKPILFYAYDYDYYKTNLVNLVDKYENLVIKKGICYSESELFSLLENIYNLFKDKEYKKQFLKLKNKYHKYQNGGYIDNILNNYKTK